MVPYLLFWTNFCDIFVMSLSSSDASAMCIIYMSLKRFFIFPVCALTCHSYEKTAAPIAGSISTNECKNMTHSFWKFLVLENIASALDYLLFWTRFSGIILYDLVCASMLYMSLYCYRTNNIFFLRVMLWT